MNSYLTLSLEDLRAHIDALHPDHTPVVETFDAKALHRWHSFDHACAQSTGEKSHHGTVEIASVIDHVRVDELLRDGWEPWTVTYEEGRRYYHLRRKVRLVGTKWETVRD